MHEAGVAQAVAAEIRTRGLAADALRLIVTGGHDEPEAFDAALRFHLWIELPGVDVEAIEIVHAPGPRLCAECATPFEGGSDTPCPRCGGPGLPLPSPERVELEWGSIRESRGRGDRSPPAS